MSNPRKFQVQEVVDCPDCFGTGLKGGWKCTTCKGTKSVTRQVSFDEVLKEYKVDVPNTGYFGIIIPKEQEE